MNQASLISSTRLELRNHLPCQSDYGTRICHQAFQSWKQTGVCEWKDHCGTSVTTLSITHNIHDNLQIRDLQVRI